MGINLESIKFRELYSSKIAFHGKNCFLPQIIKEKAFFLNIIFIKPKQKRSQRINQLNELVEKLSYQTTLSIYTTKTDFSETLFGLIQISRHKNNFRSIKIPC